MKMNLPNKLSVLRLIMVPIFMIVMLLPVFTDFSATTDMILTLSGAVLFIAASFTDMLDGKIARKYNLVTDFGKFIDPLADKFMVISSMISILVWMLLRGETNVALIFVWVVLIILLRELGVTSIRLVVAGKSGIVVAASLLGKIKTVSQMAGTVVLIVEPLIAQFVPFFENRLLSYIFMAVMAFTTLFSGIDYLRAYLPHIDSNK